MTTMFQWLRWVEYLGVVAFAASGAMTGVKKRMDPFGVIILGLAEATGGGIIRDLLLGITPPSMFRDPTYAIIAIVTAMLMSIRPLRRRLTHDPRKYELVMLLLDTFGIGLFAVIGVRTTVAAYPASGIFPMVFIGTVAATGGGILRDILAGDMPKLFTKHIYALACLAGSAVCALLWSSSPVWSMAAGAATIIVIRLLAAHYRWNLPQSSDG